MRKLGNFLPFNPGMLWCQYNAYPRLLVRIYFDSGKQLIMFNSGDSFYQITMFYKSKRFLRLNKFYIHPIFDCFSLCSIY